MASGIPSRYCVYCAQDKSWIFSGKKLKDGSKIYTNEFAVRWAGRRCPDCERARVHAAIRCDSFEKELIVSQLQEAGYTIASKTLPIKAEKDGKTLSVGIRHARTVASQIVLDKPPPEKADLYALVFNSVRICSSEQMQRLESNVSVHQSPRAKASPAAEPPSDSMATD